MATSRLVPLQCPNCEMRRDIWVSHNEEPQPKDLVCTCGATLDRGRLIGSPLAFQALKDRPLPSRCRNYDPKKFLEPQCGDWGEKMLEHPEFKNEGMFDNPTELRR